MGIGGFNAWIEKDYSDAYTNIVTSKEIYHHLYIDLNYLLHLCHYNSNDTVHLLNKMSMIIVDTCTKVQPVKSLNLYCDGTAPLAKMVIQRERRCQNIKISDDIFKTSLNFTPGTQFIEELQKAFDDLGGGLKTLQGYWKTLGGGIGVATIGMSALIAKSLEFSNTIKDISEGFDIVPCTTKSAGKYTLFFVDGVIYFILLIVLYIQVTMPDVDSGNNLT